MSKEKIMDKSQKVRAGSTKNVEDLEVKGATKATVVGGSHGSGGGAGKVAMQDFHFVSR